MTDQKERDRVWRILISELVSKLESIKYWENTTHLEEHKEHAHNLKMELSGLLGLAQRLFGYDRNDILELAKRTCPYNPATKEGLEELKRLQIEGWC